MSSHASTADEGNTASGSMPKAANTRGEKPKRTQGHKLQFILFAALVIISAVPVVLLEAWVQHSALNAKYRR